MGELTIRRNRGFPVARYQTVDKTAKASADTQTQRTAKTPTLSEPLQQLTDRGAQTAERTYESRQTLQMGEVVLAEVEERLGRMMGLAQESADGEAPDRDALQTKLEQLTAEIDRIIKTAVFGDTRLFLDGDMDSETGLDIFLNAAMGSTSGLGTAFPDWLTRAVLQGNRTAEQLLNSLGLDSSATSEELMAAIKNSSLAHNAATGYVATVYLGALISSAATGAMDAADALAGIQQLLEQVADGLSPDQALELLTNGAFSSFADFEAQFLDGAAPGMEDFLMALLLSDSGSTAALADPTALALLAALEDIKTGLVSDLMSLLDGSGSLLDAGAASGTEQAAQAGGAPAATLTLGNVQVSGQDLSGVSFDAETGVLTIGGSADVLVQGTGQGGQDILLTGSGRVTVQNAEVSTLSVDAGSARLFTVGENVLGEIQMEEGSALTLGGSGLLRLGSLLAGESNTLRLTGGAVIVEGEDGEELGTLPISVVMDGPASLAAQAAVVTNPAGQRLDPFDLIWKSLLPNWSAITAMAVDGKQVQMALWNGEHPDLARLWLAREASSHGFSVHTLVVQGKDQFGRPRTCYSYVRWNRYTGAFEEFSMYPNPFTVTGGRQAKDWAYEEATHTLYILSDQVTAISGGAGTDAYRSPFSGRIVLADGIGALELALDGVVCQVTAGRAFDLGKENDVTLILQRGSSNLFESGAGCAGISLGDGTSLRIDCAVDDGEQDSPDGSLTATGGEGGAGIGRDSGADRDDGGEQDRTSHILIRGGVITATATGGGAGIGGAVGAPLGDICITGGTVTAEAACHAAAIGAGIQGECGDVLITGSAKIAKAAGGDQGADIGACRFGRCGKVQVSGGADIGKARLCTRAGIPLQVGENTATLPQLPLSTRGLGLDGLDVSTRECAQAARAIVEADRRRVTQMQAAYSVLYTRLEVGPVTERRAAAVMMGWSPLRNTDQAGKLLEDLRQEILQANQAMSGKRDSDGVRQLLR